jgi:hypothetical protein
MSLLLRGPILVGTLWLLIGCTSGCTSEPEPTPLVDFHRDVAPIFKARCLNCHGPQQQLGGLRLDDRAMALPGGLSGKKLIGNSADESELLRRITSADPTLVMPKEGGKLSQPDIETLRRWIAAGAPWPDLQPPSGRDEFLTRYGEDLWARLGVLGHEPKVWLLLLFAIYVGLAERLHRQRIDSEEETSRGRVGGLRRLFRPISVSSFLMVLFAVLLWDVVGFSMRQAAKLSLTEQQLAELRSAAAGGARPSQLSGNRPTPLRPRGAGGVGGTYYRGNDERSEKLFNGGNYRTATMRLALLDETAKPLSVGDRIVGDKLLVRLEIERARQATRDLFTEDMIRAVLLTRRTADQKEPLPEDEPASFETLERGERWAATYKLPAYHGDADAALDGVLYVVSGAQRDGEAVRGTQQYGIVYSLRIRGRVIQPNSELWLGPILVPGNFQFPMPNTITLSEWLDTQPIPEITGENSTDPKLLGIPPHRPDFKRSSDSDP